MANKLNDYITAKDAAMQWNISVRRVIMYLAEERIPGAVKVGNTWLIPIDTVKPLDGRKNNRRGGKVTVRKDEV